MAAVTLGTETDGSILCRCRSTQLSASSPSSGSPAAPASSPSPRRRTPLDRTMCRTVSAAVHVLDFIIGYDEHDAAATRAASKYIPHGIAFNNQHPTEERLKYFGQPYLITTQNTNGIGPMERTAIQRLKELNADGLEKVMKEHQLDAIVAPNYDASSLLAIGGNPGIVVPAGYDELQGYEPSLIEMAYAFEQATKARRPPMFNP